MLAQVILSNDKAQEMVANTFSGVWLQMVLPEGVLWFLAELEMLATLLIDGKALHTTVTHCTLSQARDAWQ